VPHTWLLKTGPGRYDNQTSDHHQHSGVAEMRVLHGMKSQLNITMSMIYLILESCKHHTQWLTVNGDTLQSVMGVFSPMINTTFIVSKYSCLSKSLSLLVLSKMQPLALLPELPLRVLQAPTPYFPIIPKGNSTTDRLQYRQRLHFTIV
jgi:hypothetical protein